MLRPVPLALIFLVLCLLVPGAAHAGTWQAGRAQAVAAAAWRGQPCTAERVRIVRGGEPPHGIMLPSTTLAYVTVNADGSLMEGCTVHLTPLLDENDWPTVCTVMLHEYGHLAGRGHTSAGLMAERMQGYDPRCRDRGRAILGMPLTRSSDPWR